MVALSPSEADLKRFGDNILKEEELELGDEQAEMLKKLKLSDKKDELVDQIRDIIGKEFS